MTRWIGQSNSNSPMLLNSRCLVVRAEFVGHVLHCALLHVFNTFIVSFGSLEFQKAFEEKLHAPCIEIEMRRPLEQSPNALCIALFDFLIDVY